MRVLISRIPAPSMVLPSTPAVILPGLGAMFW